jgi:hypothetical protein
MDELEIIAEKYKKLMSQRVQATLAWNKRNRARVNEYNRIYQANLYAKKKENAKPNEKIINYSDPEQYKQYQADYRKTKRLRHLPFFHSDILI